MIVNIINRDDCLELLTKFYMGRDFQLTDFQLKPFSEEINGYLGEHWLLFIQAKCENKEDNLTFFVKTIHLPNEIMKRSHERYDIFKKEAFFYITYQTMAKEILGQVDVSFSAPCYLVTKKAIVLKNLLKEGYLLATEDYFDENHLKIGLEQIAKFHAITFAYEKFRSEKDGREFTFGEKFKDVLEEHMLILDNDVSWGAKFIKSSAGGVRALIDVIPETTMTKEIFKQKFDLALQDFYRVFNENSRYRKVICHGDLWRKNFLFKYKEKNILDCIICDYQFLRYLPPAHDVTYFIYHNGGKESRTEKFKNLCLHYYQNLKKSLSNYNVRVEDVLSQEEFLESCDYYLPAAKILKSFFASLSMRYEEYESDLFKNQEEFDNFVFGERSALMLEQFQKDLNYRNLMTELINNVGDMLVDMYN